MVSDVWLCLVATYFEAVAVDHFVVWCVQAQCVVGPHAKLQDLARK